MLPEVKQFLVEMLAQAPVSAYDWMVANTANSGVKRRAYIDVEKHVRNFLSGQTDKEWIIMPGLRGTGKTTMLTQLYNCDLLKPHAKFYLSLDKVKSVGGRMIDVIAVIEEVLGHKIEDTNEPTFILLDEVQYADDWALVIKTVTDRSKKLFVICTGSSAIMLQTNPDIARRTDIIKVHPLCFTEFVMIDQAHNPAVTDLRFPVTGVSAGIKTALFSSSNASQVYARLSELTPSIKQYWSGLDKPELIRKYFSYGTLPFTLTLPNESVVWARIYQTVNEVLARDVSSLARFNQQTVSSLPRFLFLLAQSEQISLNRLSSIMSIDIKTVRAVLDALESTEIITAIKPKGASFGKITKSYKYLFTAPAMRLALVNSGGAIRVENESRSNLRGQLLEDVVGLYFKRMFLDSNNKAIVEYDTSQGGADFIISQTGEKKDSIAIEVGVKKSTSRQALQTLNELKGKYGLVITDQPLKVDASNNTLFVPLEYFLLT